MKSEFPTHRNLLLTTAGLSFLLVAFGPKLDISLPLLGVKLPASASTGTALLVLLLYFAARCILDWTRLEPEERANGVNRIDLFMTMAISVVALVLQGRELTADLRLWRLPIYVVVPALVAGEFVAATLSVVVFSLRFVRSESEARQKALPRIPNAVRAQFIFLWIDAAIIAGMSLWITLSRAREEWLFIFAMFATPTLLHALVETGNYFWGKRLDAQRMREIYDQHDAHYRILAMTPPSEAEMAEYTAHATDEELDECRRALSSGYSPDTVGTHGWTPLMNAAANGDARLLSLFIEYGGNVDAMNDIENTALNYAAFYGNLAIVEALIAAGAAVNPRTHTPKRTPLIDAARGGHLAVVDLLLRHGADPHATDFSGDSALTHAEENAFGEVARAIRIARKERPAP